MRREIEQAVNTLLESEWSVLVDLDNLPKNQHNLLHTDLAKRGIAFYPVEDGLVIALPDEMLARHETLTLLRNYGLKVQGL